MSRLIVALLAALALPSTALACGMYIPDEMQLVAEKPNAAEVERGATLAALLDEIDAVEAAPEPIEASIEANLEADAEARAEPAT